MGGMIFDPGVLADSLSETAGYKAGLALSISELCSHLGDQQDTELILASEERPVRIRSEDYEALFYRLLHRIGHTDELYDGDFAGVGLYHKYKDQHRAEYEGVLKLFVEHMPRATDDAKRSASKAIDPTPFMRACHAAYGRIGLDIAVEKLRAIDRGMRLSPHVGLRYVEWHDQRALVELFQGSSEAPEQGRFIDQRFIDYLSNNQDRLPEVHWRKFEELTAEFFDREGFRVELGPGTNDDGVDVRVWGADQEEGASPQLIVQCKRQKAKVEKVVVKGLYADVQHESAEFGLIVTTSELSPGARTTIAARGYPIHEVSRSGLTTWLGRLRTPGTGIVRI